MVTYVINASRRVALAEMALGAATDADEGVRNRGVRLVANKLYGNQDVPELTAQVRSCAPQPGGARSSVQQVGNSQMLPCGVEPELMIGVVSL